MKAFITGASGFIGSHLVRRLLRKEWDVRLLLHEEEIPAQNRCELIQGDITDPSTLKGAFKDIDLIFHLAAALGAFPFPKKEFFRINAHGAANVLGEAQKEGVKKIIHLSSAGVLGMVKEGEVAGEDYPPHPITSYEKSKLEGERTALGFARSGMDIVVIRPGWVYGPGDKRSFKLIKAISKRTFFMVAGGEAQQTPVYIDDLVEGILLCAEKGRKGEIYHLAGGETLSVEEIVSTIASTVGAEIPRFTLPLLPVEGLAWSLERIFALFCKEAPLDRARLSFFTCPKPLSIRKAQAHLGFSPKTDFQKGIALSISWYRREGWLSR